MNIKEITFVCIALLLCSGALLGAQEPDSRSLEIVLQELEKDGFKIIIDNYDPDAFSQKINISKGDVEYLKKLPYDLKKSNYYDVAFKGKLIILRPKDISARSAMLDKPISNIKLNNVTAQAAFETLNKISDIHIGLIPDTVASRNSKVSFEQSSASIMDVLVSFAEQTGASQISISYLKNHDGGTNPDIVFVSF